jgi:Na+/proline symporter
VIKARSAAAADGRCRRPLCKGSDGNCHDTPGRAAAARWYFLPAHAISPMQWIDWLLVIAPLAFVIAFAVYTRRYVHDVVDFLAGGRCAGRYLLANARGEADSGLANTMARFEVILVSGFVLNFWEKLTTPVVLLLAITGFVIFRYRETRAMTLAQFFEMRYSRGFRLYMGMLAFLSGILNYGIFPAVSARFFIYFLGLPESVKLGPVAISTLALIMASYLALTIFMVLVGGQVTLMVTDCIEGLLSHAIYIIIAIAVFFIVSWSQIVEVMAAAPKDHSLINPFDTGEIKDFNVWFIAIGLFIRIYSTNAFQNRQGFNAAAKTPHEARMGGILGEWRGYARFLMLLLLGVCAVTFMRHPAFAQQAAPIQQSLGQIGNDYVRAQMTVPIALRYLLPVGIKGLFVSIMIMGLVAGDSGHLHSWGSIFIQDIILPLKKRAMTPTQHIWALRLAVIGVAVWAFCFSFFFPQTQFINLWWLITGGIFTGGAGAAIIGGLYWKKGTTPAAWAAAITGSVLCVTGILCSSFWPAVSGMLDPIVAPMGVTLPGKFWLNGAVSAFFALLTAAIVYVVTSLLTCRQPFNLDRMLHRGIYSVEAGGGTPTKTWRERMHWRTLLSLDHNFSRTDKWTAGGIFWWSIVLVAVNLVITAWNLLYKPWPVSWWAHYWMITGIALPCVIAVGTLIWFGIGGVRDVREFFIALRTMTRDARDDGRVVGDHNAADEPAKAMPAIPDEPSAADPKKSIATAS